MLILLQGVDDEAAFDMLRARSQHTNIKLRTLAEQLVSDYRALGNGEALPPRSVYDRALMTVHERVIGESRTQAGPGVSSGVYPLKAARSRASLTPGLYPTRQRAET